MRYNNNDLDILKKYIDSTNNLIFFLDLETFNYNTFEGYNNPSKYKSMVYSLALTYIYDDNINFLAYSNLDDFINDLKEVSNKKLNIKCWVHNGFKFDLHFLRWEFIYYYNLPVYNMYLSQADKNYNTIKIKEVKENCILEKRVKSAVNLDMVVFLDKFKFTFEDTFLKTGLSLRAIGKKLSNLGLIEKEEEKTIIDYTKYNRYEDLSDKDAKKWADYVFQNLSNDERKYIYNDVYILGALYQNYTKVFPNYDISKMTYTQNILEYYNSSPLANFQLLLKYKKIHLKYTDYTFDNENLYSYLKHFYKGGLNFYNDRYIGKIVKCKGFSIDINSSYPYVMYSKKIPTFLIDYGTYENEKEYGITNFIYDDDYFQLFKITRKEFDRLLTKVKSVILKKMLVKYYQSTSEYIYINTNTLRILKDICKITFNKLKVKSFLTFSCYYFASRKKISENYFIKQQGKSKKMLVYNSPFDIEITRYKNDKVYTSEEVANSKVLLNGIYGLPALRSHFNLFRILEDGNYHNYINMYKNSERNILFSLYITSYALYNLLSPLKNLTFTEIDNNFLYCDTDSLYIKDTSLLNKIPSEIIHPLNLGSFGIDTKTIKYFYILNHKKYAYYDKSGIHVKCGGVRQESFNKNMFFDEFIKTQFSEGVSLPNTRSILNEQKTITIYESKTELKKGGIYPLYSSDVNIENINKMFEDIKNKLPKEGLADTSLYIECPYGDFSLTEINPPKIKGENLPIDELISLENLIKDLLA